MPQALLRMLRQQPILRTGLRLHLLQQLAALRPGAPSGETAHLDAQPARFPTEQGRPVNRFKALSWSDLVAAANAASSKP